MLAVSVEAGGLGKAVAHARGQRAVSQRSARLGAGPVMASGLYTEVCEGPGKAYGDSSPVGSEPSVFFLTLWDIWALVRAGSCQPGAQVRSSVSTTAFSSTVDQAAGRLEGLWGLWRQGTKVCE